MSEPGHMRKKVGAPVVAAPTSQQPASVEQEHEEVRRTAVPGLAAGRPADPLGGTEAPHDVTAALRRRQGQGQSLPPQLAQDFGARLGTDLSNVRVHADGEADAISRSVQAAAFTHGEDVYFSSGAYQPASKGGQRLLAHELAHVAQERGSSGSGGAPMIGRADDPAEAAADRIADEITAPQPTGPVISRSVAGVSGDVRRCRDAAVIHRSLLSKLKELLGIATPAQQPVMAQPAPPVAANWAQGRPGGAPKKNGPTAGAARKAGWQPGRAGGAAKQGGPQLGGGRQAALQSGGYIDTTSESESKEDESGEAPQSLGYSEYTGEEQKTLGYSEPILNQSGEQESKEDETVENAPSDGYVEDLKLGTGPKAIAYTDVTLNQSGEQEAKEDETVENAPSDGYVEDLKLGTGPKADPYSEPILNQSGEQEAKEDESVEKVGADNYVEVIPQKKAKRAKNRSPRRELPVVEDESKEDESVEKVNADNYVEVIPQKKPKKRPELPVVVDESKAKPSDNYVDTSAGLRSEEGEESKESESSEARGPAALPSTESKSPKGTGDSRPHRAFQMVKLPGAFSDETKSGKSDMAPAIHVGLKVIKTCWLAANNPNALTDGEIAALKTYLPAKRFPITAETTDAQLKAYATQRHSDEVTKLRREELDVTDDGVLMHTTAEGRVPYPTTADGEPIIEDRVVKYDEKPEDQEKTRVEFRGGKLFRSATSDQKGAVVDTAASVTHQSGAGYEIFAVDEKNEIHMASHKIGKYHHSSLLAGGNVALAGEMKVENGKLTYLSNKSGHYTPSTEALVQFLHFLEKDGVAMDFRVFDLSGKLTGTADQVLQGMAEGKAANPELTYEVVKTNVVWAAFVQEFGEPAVMKVITEQGWTGKGKDIVDAEGKPVDLKLVRRLLKQELGAKRKPEKANGGRAKVKLDTNRLNPDRSVTVAESKWVK